MRTKKYPCKQISSKSHKNYPKCLFNRANVSDYRVGVSCFAVRYVVLTVCMHFFGLCFMTRLNCGIHLHLKSMWKYAHCLIAFSFSLHELLSPPLCDAVMLVAHHAAHLSLRDMHFILVFILKFKKHVNE